MSTNLSGTTLTLGNTSLNENTLKVLVDRYYASGSTGSSSSTNLSGNTLTLGNTSLDEETLKVISDTYYVPGSTGSSSSTNLSGTTLTLGNTSLNENTLISIKNNFNIPNNCEVLDTVILDGIECLCVATGVTIQGSNLTRIAVDKNHDLGYYQQYSGITQDGAVINKINLWRWGGYGTLTGGTSTGLGYGLQNTIKCLANTANYTKGAFTGADYDGYPLLWYGVRDFRASHSDKWFVPSLDELSRCIYPYIALMKFSTTTGVGPKGSYSSSSEYDKDKCHRISLMNGAKSQSTKYSAGGFRLCRAF